MEKIKQANEKLPLDFPLREAWQIYTKRFGIFSLILAINLSILGLMINKEARTFFVTILGATLLSIFLVYLYKRIPTEAKFIPMPTTMDLIAVVLLGLVLLNALLITIILIYGFISFFIHSF